MNRRKLTDPLKLMISACPNFVSGPAVKLLHRGGVLQDDFLHYVMIGSPSAILAGPFKGMRYSPYSYGSGVFTKFVGTYELELAPYVEALDNNRHDLVVDIGSAEGYYAVGLTRRLKVRRTVAFDIVPYAHKLMLKNARLNGLESMIETRGACDKDGLESILALAKRPLVISDCEGFEDEILDPAKVPGLLRSTMIVETHDHFVTGVTDRIMTRFAESHDVERVAACERKLDDLTIQLNINKDDLFKWIQEPRPDTQCYLVMTPRANS